MSTVEPLWGAETTKAIANFPVSGRPVPPAVIHWLARIKGAAAAVNAELGLLDPEVGAAIERAAAEVAAGEHDEQFPVDVFQTGSGTSSNMNVNEVLAALAARALGRPVHPNDDVNHGQSSNDVFPTAVHLAGVEGIARRLAPAAESLAAALQAKGDELADVVKAGRTHLMDAVPVTLGQELHGHAAQVRSAAVRLVASVERLAQVPLGGTAVGTGLNTDPRFAAAVRARLSAQHGIPVLPPADPFEGQASRDGIVDASGALKVLAVALTKVANDLRLLSSGPRTGFGEIVLPELQKGSSIMPGKVNPVIPEVVLQVAAQVVGNDTAITVGGMSGTLELNVMVPLLARNLLESIDLLTAACTLLADRCVRGIEADVARCLAHAEATLATATALNPHIGYDAATTIVREAAASGRPVREVAREHGVPEAVLDEALDLHRLARGG